MQIDTFQLKLYELSYTCGVNQRYHQTLEWYWGVAERGVRIVVGVLAVAGVSSGDNWTTTIGYASLVAAIVLNIIPLGDREKFHAELFRAWSDLRRETEKLDHCGTQAATKNAIRSYHVERLSELEERKHALNGSEPAPWRCLLKRCEGDETESRWGAGIRTTEQVEAERVRRLTSSHEHGGAHAISEAEEEAGAELAHTAVVPARE